VIEHRPPTEPTRVLVGTVDADLEHASVEQITEAGL
jgi:hypothetical protein